MRISPVSSYRYQSGYQTKTLKSVREKSTAENPDRETTSPAFKGVMTKFLGGIGGIGAAIAIIGTGGAAAVILPAIAYAGTCAGVGYAIDKDLEKDNDNDKKDNAEK